MRRMKETRISLRSIRATLAIREHRRIGSARHPVAPVRRIVQEREPPFQFVVAIACPYTNALGFRLRTPSNVISVWSESVIVVLP